MNRPKLDMSETLFNFQVIWLYIRTSSVYVCFALDSAKPDISEIIGVDQ